MNTNQPNQTTTPQTANTQPTNPPPAIQASPQPSTPKKKTLWLLIFLIVLLSGATGVFAYKYYEVKQQLDNQQQSTPTPLPSPPLVVGSPSPATSSIPEIDPTTDWKIYKDTKSSFKIPPNWTAQKSPSNDNNYIVTITPQNSSKYQPFPAIQISINTAQDDNGQPLQLLSLQQAKLHYSEMFDASTLKVKGDYLINQKPALMIEGNLSGPGPGEGSYSQYQFIQFPNEVVIVQLSDKNLQKQLNQILNTFKLLK